jgi:hypothetical protein
MTTINVFRSAAILRDTTVTVTDGNRVSARTPEGVLIHGQLADDCRVLRSDSGRRFSVSALTDMSVEDRSRLTHVTI